MHPESNRRGIGSRFIQLREIHPKQRTQTSEHSTRTKTTRPMVAGNQPA